MCGMNYCNSFPISFGVCYFTTPVLVVGSGIVTRRPLVLQLIHIPQLQEHIDGNGHIETYYGTHPEGKDFIVQRLLLGVFAFFSFF